MTDDVTMAVIALSALAAVGIAAATLLAGWRGWLRLQHAALAPALRAASPEETAPAHRIELADLRERVRKLEAIAAGVEL